jgi:hypothetical protein
MSTRTRPPLDLIPAPGPEIEYLSPNKAAERLGIDPSTLYRHYGAAMRSGQIKTIKIGAARRILWSSLIAYIEGADGKAA